VDTSVKTLTPIRAWRSAPVSPPALACRFSARGRVFGHRGALAALALAGADARASGVFRFDHGAPAGDPSAGCARFDGAVSGLEGRVGPHGFGSSSGVALIGRGVWLSHDEPAMDLLQLAAAPPSLPGRAVPKPPADRTGDGAGGPDGDDLSSDLHGFRIPGFRLLNVRLFWVQPTADADAPLVLPLHPPEEPGRLALDFLPEDRPAGPLQHVFIDGLTVQPQARRSAEVAAAPALRAAGGRRG
jgi:hypothetical protein